MKSFKEFERAVSEAKRGLYANIHAKRKRGESPAKPGDKDYPAKDAFKKAARTAKEELELTQEGAAGQKSLVSPPAADLMPREENLTREKILEATLKAQARKLEIPVAHHSALE